MTKNLSVLSKNLRNLKKRNLYRSLKMPLKNRIDFCSNDYLGFSKSLKLKNKILFYLKKKLFVGAGSSRLVRGNTKAHQDIEKELSLFVQRENSIIFSSGYLANVGLLSALCKGAQVFSDERNHASLIDGIRLSGSKPFIYLHRDMKDLEKKIKKEAFLNKKKRKIIVTESLFSMDGDFAPLEKLICIAKKYGAFLYVDEAHATGVFGEKGQGCLGEILQKDFNFFKGFPKDLLISIHTFGKSLGLSGAFVACSHLLKDFFINHCRTLIYTTGVSPLLIAGWKAAIELLEEEKSKLKRLHKKSLFFRQSLKEMGFRTLSESQIVPIILGSSKRALVWEKDLKNKGFDIRAIRYPTVSKGSARLRICIHADHTKKNMALLLKALKKLKEREKKKSKKER